MAKKSAPSPDTARRIWLAGIGAYGRAFTEAQESLARLTDESSRVFDDLVTKGEAIERKVEEQRKKTATHVAAGAHSFEERIRRMRDRIGLGEDHAALAEEVQAIDARLKRVEALIGARSEKPRAKRKARKKSA